ncbi:MAG: 2-phospho-L-lactate transferase [Lysobacterales bacterium]
MNTEHYLAITGGVGGAKLALGLTRLLSGSELSLAVNTADDFVHMGLHISPDIDTLVYTLAGESNPETGWGRRNESWNFMQALGELGGETWFALGDRDLAVNVERTHRLRCGQTLSQVTTAFASAFGVAHAVLPMTDDPVSTRVRTKAGELEFQDYFVRERCGPAVMGFQFAGVESARLNPAIVSRLESPALAGVILCPSNPFVSMDPILALPGMQERLQACQAPVVAVSPVVGGSAIKGPTVKMMAELSVPNTASWVAEHYRAFLDGFVIDSMDSELAPEIVSLGIHPAVANTVMVTLEDRVNLARCCLQLLKTLRGD